MTPTNVAGWLDWEQMIRDRVRSVRSLDELEDLFRHEREVFDYAKKRFSLFYQALIAEFRQRKKELS